MADRCESCSAPVIWCVTANGRPMPVDAEPVPNGNLELVRVAGGGMRAAPAGKSKPDAAPDLFAKVEPPKRYVSHFATCAEASQWRKRNRR